MRGRRYRGDSKNRGTRGRKELERRQPRLTPEGKPLLRRRPAPPGLALSRLQPRSGAAQTGGGRINPTFTGREPQAALPSSPRSTAPKRSPSSPRRPTSASRQDGDSFFLAFSGLIYCLEYCHSSSVRQLSCLICLRALRQAQRTLFSMTTVPLPSTEAFLI